MTANVAGKTSREGGSVAMPAVTERPAITDRITVALVRKAGEDLESLQERTGLSKTDVVNRAISLYEFIESQMQAGKQLLIKDPDSDETQLIRFL
jgi:hypothetical protein